MAKKVSKKSTKKEEGAGRVKIADLPQGERDNLAHGLIDELYGGKLAAEEKSKRRQRLRTIDADWLETYASYIERKGYAKKAEPKAKPAAKKKVSKKAAKRTTPAPSPDASSATAGTAA